MCILGRVKKGDTMDVATILNLIDAGEYGLPEFQRGYVWSREQVRRFMSSLYHENPVGSLLIWTPEAEADIRGNGMSGTGSKLLIDGQQRITTLYGVSRGKPPPFFSGNENSFLKLYFHLDGEKGEEFEFYGPVKMKGNPRWVNVTDVLQQGAGNFLQDNLGPGGLLISDLNNLNRLDRILRKDFHSELITDKDLDEVVDIFNKVNSGGTKLSAGDLALARISAKRPTARGEMQALLKKWDDEEFRFSLDWLLRGITVVLTGDSRFRTIATVTPEKFDHGLRRYERHVNEILLQLHAWLGLDHARVLRSVFSFPLLARYLELNEGFRQGEAEVAGVLYWYIHTVLWGRYSGSTESRLYQDLAILHEARDWQAQLNALADTLRIDRGTLRLSTQDFHGSWTNNRFYPLLYMLTRVWRARDLCKNIPLSMNLIGNPLELHHLFPKKHLYDMGRNRRDVNTLANFAFLTTECNRSIGWCLPRDYFAECESMNPGVLASQWIPDDPRLWELENYDEFLGARRELLTAAANALLDSLSAGHLPQIGSFVARPAEPVPRVRAAHIASDEEEHALLECQQWMEARGLPRGETGYELVDEKNSSLLAVLDLAWSDGVQEGLSQPVALLIDEEDETRYAAHQHGFRYFTDVPEFQQFVEQTALAE